MSELALLRFTGADTLSFLQGYLTSDAFELREDRLSPTALCNLKGRVVANGWCYKRDNGIDFIVHRSLTQTLCGFLKNYLVFSKTDLEDCSNSHMVFGSIEAESSSGLHFGEGQCLFVVEELATATKLYESEESLSPGVWAYRLIHDEIALVSLPVSERFLPQMLGLDRTGAVDFDKGCYLGQEVVARAQHRGKVKRELRRLSWQGERPPAGHELQTADGLISGVVIQADVDAPDGYCLAVSSAARAGQVAVNSQSATKFQSVP
ncbi:MAG: hypothetical protein O7F71_16525 [Gammaproteobacteria bacterium]|nr:hypothetical protein [Gammaproteobacteria bacterium]